MSNDLVAYSRAGDAFHYRWAARRCLRLVYPNSSLQTIKIEGSNENEKAGEYVIDVSEYSYLLNNKKKIEYYQLKHTTVQYDDPFTLSDLKATFKGFSDRYLQHQNNASDIADISFTLITNRKIADSFKNNMSALANKETPDDLFLSTIVKYTNLASDELTNFCSLIKLEDSEGDYNLQKEELRIELAQLLCGTIDNAQIDSIIALVQERALPASAGLINQQDVLKRLGITSERMLYPAPPVWEKLDNIIEREHYVELIDCINKTSSTVIVHAAGGVGKSVFCRQLINSLPEGSIGIAYDSFGAGKYRNPSEPRHGYRHALVQIANELASKGFCEPLLVQSNSHDEHIVQNFLWRIDTSVRSLKKTIESAKLFILIDAADNAEMAAREYNQPCFAHTILREIMPKDCILVLLCRTERISLLNPPSNIPQLELKLFSEEESLLNLRKWFSNANKEDGAEFHRLTGGNPRVQANALNVNYTLVSELLNSLGPSGLSVEKQIEQQLNSAISRIKDLLPNEYQYYINSICLGLASLPPHIPIAILSKAANVSIENIKSFVADLGRYLWLSDLSVQFRDEPSETWFRKKFLAETTDYETYINLLEPLASESSYISESLPQLYLLSNQYKKLIDIALSEDFLPVNNPIEARNIRVYRLQFAFKAALKAAFYKDALKLAIRAGEEVAGDQRQMALLQNNLDLLISIQGKEKIQEIAFKRMLSGQWDGSDNVYSASLLSGIQDYLGEARGYLRAALNWLHIKFDEQRKNKTDNDRNRISDRDILELAYAHLNIYGVKKCFGFLLGLRPKEAIFRIVQDLSKRLVDVGRFKEINEFLSLCTREPYFTIAISSELIIIGKFPEGSVIETCLDLLCSSRHRITKPNNPLNDRLTPAIISFAEVCMYRNLEPRKILRVLRHYVPIQATRMVSHSHFSTERTIFLRSLAIRMLLSDKTEADFDEISPKHFVLDKKSYHLDNEIREFREVINGLFPWFLLRAKILSNKDINLIDVADQTNEASLKARNSRFINHDTLPKEIADICSSIIIFSGSIKQEDLSLFYEKNLQYENEYNLFHRINLLRAAYRISHLDFIQEQLESSANELIKKVHNDGPEEIADRYVSLARAVLISSRDDASVYFDEAINIASKFGDELVERWESLVSLAKRACDTKSVSHELAYRFIRCSEIVGENVSREKHWNRSEAISVCTRMSSGIGISALSRWRDREIGRFEYQLKAILHELVSSKVISSTVGWSLCRFLAYHDLNEFLTTCLDNETSHTIKQRIFDDAIYLLQIEGTTEDYWQRLNNIAISFNLKNDHLAGIIKFYSEQKNSSPEKATYAPVDYLPNNSSEKKWLSIFEGLNITTLEGFSDLIRKFNNIINDDDQLYNIDALLKEALIRVEEKQLGHFLEVLLTSDDVNNYNFQNVLCSLPQKWINKISFKKKWPEIIYRFGQRYAQQFTHEYPYDSAVKDLKLDDQLIEKLKAGVFSGLANSYELANASNFFGFVNLSSTLIDPNDALDLVHYSLSRFELHINDDFGDGVWNDWLHVTDNVNKNIAGFIWSALGSPRSKYRWNSAHCIRKLAELNSTEIIDELINWLKHDKVDAFGSNQFPFYNLHARQYLLIALARISKQQPDIFKKYSNDFLKYSLSESHVLIQKFASDIALSLQKSFHELYDKNTFESLMNTINPIVIHVVDHHFTTDSYWHKQKQVPTDIDFHFAYDFDSFWFEPLGNVFGVPENQIQDLAANVIVKEWGLGGSSGSNKDPRGIIWNSSYYERETWHDHSNYPITDNFDFYLSYHAMLIVAAKLIKKMPVVSEKDWCDDELEGRNRWNEWLSRHLLTRADGKWLADIRGPLPLERPQWVYDDKYTDWQSSIDEDDFLNSLKIIRNDELWIPVHGGWIERKNERTESISISSALVSKEASDSLLRALATCEDPFDYKLPYFREDDMEMDYGIFRLKGWVKEGTISKRLDEFDPYADHIDYPEYSIGNTIVDELNLEIDSDGRSWNINNSQSKSLSLETWSSYRENRENDPDQSGVRLLSSLPFLNLLCNTYACDLIIDVGIQRNINYKYDRESHKYFKPKHKLFIYSSDGKFRTTDTCYQLR